MTSSIVKKARTITGGNGGGLYISNSGTTIIDLTSVNLLETSAFTDGGFLYKTGSGYNLILDSVNGYLSSAVNGNGGFAYMSGSSISTVTIRNSCYF